ncbi:transcription activator MSS11-like isoform X6 [Pistacia vera]|uniref:transcription activator MSS11-like isoform X6 n=1 Tax=Pistacia vera TaxID=55513 RepID=UPI00126342B3|nr:transcription activator MSS11-like isoform X6 [Pistacia vera]
MGDTQQDRQQNLCEQQVTHSTIGNENSFQQQLTLSSIVGTNNRFCKQQVTLSTIGNENSFQQQVTQLDEQQKQILQAASDTQQDQQQEQIPAAGDNQQQEQIPAARKCSYLDSIYMNGHLLIICFVLFKLHLCTQFKYSFLISLGDTQQDRQQEQVPAAGKCSYLDSIYVNGHLLIIIIIIFSLDGSSVGITQHPHPLTALHKNT